ncbi:MAG: hypothetical protein MJ180_01500 [Candidatus Gastranaerophilales bacterium]|nr:hypothetical protein [Candidatus Gastranaerophilales bacterium]
MEISKITSSIEQMGYNPFSVSGTGEQDIAKFAQANNISVEEAKAIFEKAEEKAIQNDKMQQEASAMLDMLSDQDEEELVVLDDADFDNFLNENTSEEQMQNIFNQQLFLKNGNNQNNSQNNANMFNNANNPFLKTTW